jgi:hypothetical protein
MYVPEIIEVKKDLEVLKASALIKEWQLPYENLLTRLNAAIFFLEPANDSAECLENIWQVLEKYKDFSFRMNEEKRLSSLPYRVTFSEEEKKKNSNKLEEASAGL